MNILIMNHFGSIQERPTQIVLTIEIYIPRGEIMSLVTGVATEFYQEGGEENNII